MSLTGKPSLASASPITNDGWWPDVSTADLVSKYRVPSDIADDTISTGLSLAVVRVNETLDPVKQHLLTLGYTDFESYLAANSSPVVSSELLLVHYEAAVYSRAKAFLLQQFISMNRREVAENQAKESEQTEKFWLDESQSSIASLWNTFFPDNPKMKTHGFHAVLL